MKNFTNNFKQFTSRLSARWLIMVLMLLVGTSSAWAVRVYYVNTTSWSKVNCYAWKDGGSNEAGWPGTDITSKKCNFKVNGYDVYYYDTNDTSDKCIFNNGSSQSSDLIIANGPYFYGNTARSSVKDIYDNDAWMFYINQDYNTSALCIHNGSSYIYGTYVASKNYYISTSKSNVNNKAINVTNNCGNWTGTGGKTGGTTVGTTYVHPGCYYKTGNQGTSIVKAATLSSLSIASSISMTDASSVNVTAKATSSTSSYGKALKAMYFVDNVYVTESAQLSTSGTTTTLDLSSFSDGSHTLSVILTDGTISYPDASTATFTIISCTELTAPTLTITPITKCNNTYTSGKIVVEGYNATTYTYVLKKGGNTVSKTYNNGYTIANGEQGEYTVVMDLKAGGSCESVESTGSVNIVDKTPVVENLTMPANFSSCDGQLVQGIALQNWNEADGYTYTYQWQSSANGTSFTNMNGMTSSGMTPLLDGTTWYRVKVTKSKDGCTSQVATSGAVKVTANSLSAPTVSIASASYDMNAGTFTVIGNLDQAGCSNDIYVGYRYKLHNADTWSDLINTHRLTEAGEFTIEGISIAGAAVGQTYLFQTYAINGHPNYQESSAEFSSSTIEVEVQDGYTVYVRRPKSGDNTNVYTNWYELSSVKGGAPYVKSGAIQGTGSSNNKATTNNTGGTEMTYAFTDCDGYIWDKFKPAKDQTQFHVHALNDDAYDGWGTFSKTATITDDQDYYFTLSGWTKGQYGVTITSTDQPTRGVRIKALGSTQVISNNMASFAAISFNGNCTGKELLKDAEGDPTGFQWKYYNPGTSSWSNYDGEGATWNNIRPRAAGKYKLVCTMEDMTTVESNEVEITTTSENYDAADLINIESNLPIIMVNTGDNNGFPACSVAGSDYPSKHADKFKKKLSVDVKIKVGDNIVYDKKARMAYRGSSSLNFQKKSYAFCPGADMCGLDEDKSPDYVDTKKIDMLDLITEGTKKSAKDKDWVLYAATPAPSMMRNILAMETFSAMTGKWGVKNQYVELYVDGEYQGVYVFMDKITQNEKRVNVSWNVDGSSKGFIVKFDKTDLADRYEIPNGDQKTFESAMKTGNTGVISYGTEIDQRFEIEYPEKDKVIKAGGSWADVYTFVKGKIDAFESALKDGDFNTVRTIIDYESWADFFILTEFAKNGDGYRASCVFVYEGGLLKAYPLWDYELSFNNETRQEHEIDKTTGLLAKQTTYSKVSGENGTFPAPFWWTGNYYNQKTYKGLLDDPCFVAMVNARWEEHTGVDGALSKAKMQALVNAYNAALTTTDDTGGNYNTPQKREAHKWPYDGTTRGKTCNDKTIGYYGQGAGSAISKVVGYDDQNSVEGSLDQLNAWIGDTGRRVELGAAIEELANKIEFAITVVADKTTTTPWRPVTVTVNSNSGYEYSITPEPAKVEENGHMYTLYFARPENTLGENFTTVEDAYTFTATTGQADQCGTTQGSATSAEVKIDLADVVENCPQP